MRPRKTILCVDDSEAILSLRKFMLETRGYRVLTALGGDQALEIFNRNAIDLVLTDLVMPGIDGNELIRRMKEMNPEVPMLLVSGKVSDLDLAVYADAFLVKGSALDLLERLRVMLRRKRGPKPKKAVAA